MMDDYFGVEDLILARLRSHVSGFRLVQGAREMKEILTKTGTTPALHLLYDGQESRLGAGNAMAMDQLWLTVIAIHNLRDGDCGRGERQEAGPLMVQTCQALLGWQPGPDHGPMTMASAPAPLYAGGGAFFPLRFTTRMILTGA